jgi:hypothetical protein
MRTPESNEDSSWDVLAPRECCSDILTPRTLLVHNDPASSTICLATGRPRKGFGPGDCVSLVPSSKIPPRTSVASLALPKHWRLDSGKRAVFAPRILTVLSISIIPRCVPWMSLGDTG